MITSGLFIHTWNAWWFSEATWKFHYFQLFNRLTTLHIWFPGFFHGRFGDLENGFQPGKHPRKLLFEWFFPKNYWSR